MKNTPTRLFVENLSPHTTVESMNGLFAEFGTIRSISLATDVMTGRCGGFGFVHLYELDPGTALHALDGTVLGGRILRVIVDRK